MNTMVTTRKIDAAVSIDEVKTALEKSAANYGKCKSNKEGNIFFRPKSAIHQLTISVDVEHPDENHSVVTFAGKRGMSFSMLVMMIVLAVVLSMTVVGILIFIWMVVTSNKLVQKAYDDTIENALNLL